FASATTGQGILGSIPGSGKVIAGVFFGIFENFAVVARSLELLPVYDYRLTPHCMVPQCALLPTSSGMKGCRNYDCRARLGFDSWSGKVPITAYFSEIAGSLKLCLVYNNRLTSYYMGLITQSGCTVYSDITYCNGPVHIFIDKLFDCTVGAVAGQLTVMQCVAGSIPVRSKFLCDS
ncbi:hypothetical protein SFRURICE_021098, partial [Spodoptera frugiperda]